MPNIFKITTYVILICWITSAISQVDSTKLIKYTGDFKFKEGIFISFDQVKQNKPLSKSRIITSIDIEANDFFEKITTESFISFYDDLGLKQTIETKKIWGFSWNGTLYVQHNKQFNRIPVIGRACHFVSEVTVYRDRFPDPYYSPYYNPAAPTAYASEELRQYLLDFNTGKIMEYDYTALQIVLMQDVKLYDEYNAFKKRKKKQLLYQYLRKFNERNPLYFPIN